MFLVLHVTQPSAFLPERMKVAYVILRLTRRAADCGTAMWDNGRACCVSFLAFAMELCRVFDPALLQCDELLTAQRRRRWSQVPAPHSLTASMATEVVPLLLSAPMVTETDPLSAATEAIPLLLPASTATRAVPLPLTTSTATEAVSLLLPVSTATWFCLVYLSVARVSGVWLPSLPACQELNSLFSAGCCSASPKASTEDSTNLFLTSTMHTLSSYKHTLHGLALARLRRARHWRSLPTAAAGVGIFYIPQSSDCS
ncbi:uncharacterized protein LOC127449121 [Myxocyprinus asiaticus]|uniref:uncharacterized protein LOC127449121 n=1 Tax=Myxocyprinus asiaticus TaxID=70543 RepID=UPI002221C6F3|nr:uncharacterized protein LOC127449121 [Myxocyprinus asiaticus]